MPTAAWETGEQVRESRGARHRRLEWHRRAVAERLRDEGARVASLDLTDTAPEGVLALTGDVRRSAEIDAAFDRAEAELGPLDVLVCSAGITGDSLRTVDVGDEEWRRVLAINAEGVSSATAPPWRGWPSAITGGSSTSPREGGARGWRRAVGYDRGEADHRLRLVLSEHERARLTLVLGDITDLNALGRALDEHEITRVVHLAALQVPFCRADPVLGARVNVVGTVNVFESVKAPACRFSTD